MAGIYIHIPFCRQKCTYCDFHFSTSYASYQQEMVSAIVRELGLRAETLRDQLIETVYFGGGTPSLLSESQLLEILQAVHTLFSVSATAEYTLEANPDDITDTLMQVWTSAGINRMSIGVQSFDDRDLEWMNRAHTGDQGLNSVKTALNGGITNISLDLIYGLPEMDNARWLEQIEKAIALNVTHISAYCLTIEEKTVLHQWVKQKKIIPAGNEQQGEQFEILVNTLAAAGFAQYEISNFAKPGYISRHNSNYWKGIHYLGAGPSAHSFNGTSRSWNISSNQKYMKLVRDEAPWFETEILTPENQYNELLLTGLRTMWGVDLEQLGQLHTHPNTFNEQLKLLTAKGWMTVSGSRMILTPEGRLWADAIAQDLFI